MEHKDKPKENKPPLKTAVHEAFETITFDCVEDKPLCMQLGDTQLECAVKLDLLVKFVQQHLYKNWLDKLASPETDAKTDAAWEHTLALEFLPELKRGPCSHASCNHSTDKRLWCTGCYAVCYCSAECQRTDRRRHKSSCNADLKLQEWDEYKFAAVRTFNHCFKFLMANIGIKGEPMACKDKRMVYRGWRNRVLCEKIGAYMASEAIKIVMKEMGFKKLLRFCVSETCEHSACQSARQHFRDKGMIPLIGRTVALPLIEFDKYLDNEKEKFVIRIERKT